MSDSADPEPTDVYIGWAVTDALVRVGRCILDGALIGPQYEKTVIEKLLIVVPMDRKA